MHLCSLAPEGPARPQKALHPSPGELGSKNNSGSSGWYLFQNSHAFTESGEIYLETGKHDSIGKVQVPTVT